MRFATCEECGGRCCKFFVIAAPRSGNPDFERYIGLHVKVMDTKRHGRVAVIPVLCRNLTPGGKCADYENRPDVCRNMNSRTLHNYAVPVGCKYDITGEEGEDFLS